MFRRAWRRWIKITTFIGTVQMIIFLSIMYWTMVPLIAIPLKILSDPLGRRRSTGGAWIKRLPINEVLESMKEQG
jgi:Ni/Fe-hydrogenase subunit HybB-like protein